MVDGGSSHRIEQGYKVGSKYPCRSVRKMAPSERL